MIKPKPKHYPLYIINIEGLDGSGKQTISNELKSKLESMGYKADIASFPMYDRWHSFLVKWHLRKPNIAKWNPRFTSLLYAFDRFFAWHFHMKKKYKEPMFLILDRYVPSNIIYQATKIPETDPVGRLKVANFIQNVEHKLLRLPYPDLTIVLDVPVERSIMNMQSRTSTDAYEKKEFLRRVKQTIQFFTDMYNWELVPVTKSPSSLELLPPGVIAKKIVTMLRYEIVYGSNDVMPMQEFYMIMGEPHGFTYKNEQTDKVD